MLLLILISTFLPGGNDLYHAKACIHADSLSSNSWAYFASELMLQGDPLYDWALAKSEYHDNYSSDYSLDYAREFCLQGETDEAIRCLEGDSREPIRTFAMQIAILQDCNKLDESQALLDSCHFTAPLIGLVQARQTRLVSGLEESRELLQQLDPANLGSDELQMYLLELGYHDKFTIKTYKDLYSTISSYFVLFGLSNAESISHACDEKLIPHLSSYYAYIRNSHKSDSYEFDGDSDANNLFFKALLAFQQNRYTEAIDFIECVPDSSLPGHRVTLLKGLILLRVGRYAEVYSMMEQSLIEGKHSPELFFVQGLAAELSSDIPKATELYLIAGSRLNDAMVLDHFRHMASPSVEDYNFGLDTETCLERSSVSRFSGRTLFSYSQRTGEMKTMDFLLSSYLNYSFGYNGSYAGLLYSHSLKEYPEISQKLKSQTASALLNNYFDENYYYSISSDYNNYSFTSSRYDLDVSAGIGYNWDISTFASLKPSIKLGWALYSEEDNLKRLLLGTAAVRASFSGTRYSSYIPDLIVTLSLSQGLSSSDIFEYDGKISAAYHINRHFSLSSEYRIWKNVDLRGSSDLQTELSSILTIRY